MQSSKPVFLPIFKRLMNTNRRRFRYFLTRLETVKPKGLDKMAAEGGQGLFSLLQLLPLSQYTYALLERNH